MNRPQKHKSLQFRLRVIRGLARLLAMPESQIKPTIQGGEILPGRAQIFRVPRSSIAPASKPLKPANDNEPG